MTSWTPNQLKKSSPDRKNSNELEMSELKPLRGRNLSRFCFLKEIENCVDATFFHRNHHARKCPQLRGKEKCVKFSSERMRLNLS